MCVFVCNCVNLCGILCEYVCILCQSVSFCVILCRFVCIPVCIVCICTYFRVPNCGVCISTPEIDVPYRVPNELFIKVSVLGCTILGVCVHVCIWGCVNMGGFCVHMCQLCVFLCVLCVFVRILVWNPVNSCRNVWNTVFCVSFCEFYGMT
jgi:hypothetical protein